MWQHLQVPGTPVLQAVMGAELHHQNAGGRTQKNLKIRLWMLFQEEEDGCTSPEVPSTRRVAQSCSLTPATLTWRRSTLGMLHPSAPVFLAG